MKRRLPVLSFVALVAAYLAPGVILEALLRLQKTSLDPPALLVAYAVGALLIVFPISYLALPRVLSRRRRAVAASRIRATSLHALRLVMAFLPPWHLAAYFGAAEVPRILLTAGGTAVLLLLTEPIFEGLDYSFFGDD